MARRHSDPNRNDLLQGTLDMLVLRTLLFGPVHGHGIAKRIEQVADGLLALRRPTRNYSPMKIRLALILVALFALGASSPAPLQLTNLELDVLGDVWLDGDRLAFRVSEVRQGADLNGDSDTLDSVLHVHDFGTGVTSNLELDVLGDVWLDGDRLAFRVSEARQGADLNSDSDTFDSVLHVHDFGTGVTSNLELDASANVWLDDDRLAFGVSEVRQGADLNGDSDTFDSVLHVHDFGTGVTSNLELDALGDVWLDGDRLAFRVSEDFQEADLNGDSDTDDFVLHVHDFGTGRTSNLELDASGGTWLDGDRLAFLVSEASQGADLNGDSDERDFVLHTGTFPSFASGAPMPLAAGTPSGAGSP